eukprot:ctg_660.g352
MCRPRLPASCLACSRILAGRTPPEQPLLPQRAGRRSDRAERGVRPGHPSRVRLGSPARRWRRWAGGRGHRLGGGHEAAVRRHSAGHRFGEHDHERGGAAGAGHVYRGRRRAGRAPGTAQRHHSERHPQRVHGAQHLHLSAATEPAHCERYHGVRRAAPAPLQHHLGVGVSHAGGGRGRHPRTRVHPGRRHRVSAVCSAGRTGSGSGGAAHVVLFRHRHAVLHRDRQVTCRAPAVGAAGARAVCPAQPAVAAAAHPLSDQRLLADRTGAVEQRGAHHGGGNGGHPGRHAEPTHQCAGRGHRLAQRVCRPGRPQHPTHSAKRDRHDLGGRPAGTAARCPGCHRGAARSGAVAHRGADVRHEPAGRLHRGGATAVHRGRNQRCVAGGVRRTRAQRLRSARCLPRPAGTQPHRRHPVGAYFAAGGGVCATRRPPAASAGGQGGTGRPRPRRQSHRCRIRRPRFRCGCWAAVSDARGGGATGHRGGCARGGRFIAGGRAPHAGARAGEATATKRRPRRACGVRRGDSAPRLRRAVPRGRVSDIRAGHPHSGRGVQGDGRVGGPAAAARTGVLDGRGTRRAWGMENGHD